MKSFQSSTHVGVLIFKPTHVNNTNVNVKITNLFNIAKTIHMFDKAQTEGPKYGISRANMSS